jgi:Spy/CpxP family protein refolding chaperone
MNRTLKSLVLAVSLVAPAGAFAATADNGAPAAEHAGHHRGFHMYRKIADHASELGIPPATLEKMKGAFEAARPDFQRLRQDMQQARESGDQARITAAQNALRDRGQALRTQIEGLLTPEQKAAIKQFVGKHRHEGGEKSSGG